MECDVPILQANSKRENVHVIGMGLAGKSGRNKAAILNPSAYDSPSVSMFLELVPVESISADTV